MKLPLQSVKLSWPCFVQSSSQIGCIKPLCSTQLDARRIQAGLRFQHYVPLPACFVEDQSSHHAPATPKSFPEILLRCFLRSPAFKPSRNDTGNHNHRVQGFNSLRLQVHSNREGVVVDSFPLMPLMFKAGSALVTIIS